MARARSTKRRPEAGSLVDQAATVTQKRLPQLGERLDVLEKVEARLVADVSLRPVAGSLVRLRERALGGTLLEEESALHGQIQRPSGARNGGGRFSVRQMTLAGSDREVAFKAPSDVAIGGLFSFLMTSTAPRRSAAPARSTLGALSSS